MLYRLRQWAHRKAFRWSTRAIDATPPLACNPRAACAIHTMLSERDVPMYLPAIKSLLRFHRDLAVVVHSDGSLTRSAGVALQRHVPGIRLIDRAEADAGASSALAERPYLRRWRVHDASWLRVIDTELFCTTGRRIIMDADVITIRRPDEIIAWIEGDGPGGFLFGQPPDRELVSRPGRPHVQTIFRHSIAGIAARLGLPAFFPQGATSGFYGCDRVLSLDRIEAVLQAGEAEGVPMQEWGSEQCIVIYLLAATGARRLDPRRYLNFDPTARPHVEAAACIHFYGTYRYYRRIYPDLVLRVSREILAS